MKTFLIKSTIVFILLFSVIGLFAQTPRYSTLRMGQWARIGPDKIDSSACFEISRTDKGFLIKQITTVQRDLISGPAHGLIINNFNTDRYEQNIGTPAAPNWQPFGGAVETDPVFIASPSFGITSTGSGGVITTIERNNIVTNNAKVSNVTTNLTEGITTTTTVDVNSSDGTNATLQPASTIRAGVMTKSKFDEVEINNAKVTNATHTGEVTGATVLTVDKTAISNQSTVTAIAGDFVLIGDGSDAGNLKKVNASDFLLAGSTTFNNITDVTITGGAQGDVIYFNGTNWVNLGPGTLGHVLTTNGAGLNPTWEAAGGGGSDGDGIYDGSGSLIGATVVTMAANTLDFNTTSENNFSLSNTSTTTRLRLTFQNESANFHYLTYVPSAFAGINTSYRSKYIQRSGTSIPYAFVSSGAGTYSSFEFITDDAGLTLHNVRASMNSLGNWGLGTTPTATTKLIVRGVGTGVGTTFLVENSSGTDRFKVLDDGTTTFSDLAGSGTRVVVADANGIISANDAIGNFATANLTLTADRAHILGGFDVDFSSTAENNFSLTNTTSTRTRLTWDYEGGSNAITYFAYFPIAYAGAVNALYKGNFVQRIGGAGTPVDLIQTISGGGNFEWTTDVTALNSPTKRMTLLNTGNLGVGVTPTSKLHVNGDIRSDGVYKAGATNGIGGTFNFNGVSSGDILTMTFIGGILTGTTTVP